VKTYQITFVAYTIFPSLANYRNEFMPRTVTGEILTEELAWIFIELSKLKDILKKPVESMTPLEMWSIFFECADDPSYRNVINEIIRVKEEIQMASTLLQSISQDDYEKARFLSKRKFENDLESDRNTALKIDRLETAKVLIGIGLNNNQISEATRLSTTEIEKLRKK